MLSSRHTISSSDDVADPLAEHDTGEPPAAAAHAQPDGAKGAGAAFDQGLAGDQAARVHVRRLRLPDEEQSERARRVRVAQQVRAVSQRAVRHATRGN